MTFTKRLLAASLAAAIIPLSACSSEPGTQANSVTDDNLAGLLSRASDITLVARTLSDTELAPVFDGVGNYTIFAPEDAAFEGMEGVQENLSSAENRPAVVAMLRGHIVPGYMTLETIKTALSGDTKSIEMATMDGGILTFSRDGEDIVATSADGKSARLSGTSMEAANGVAIPIDGLLKDLAVLDAPAA
ncbi:fasciclin domain-containing protein [Altererythrobacter aquiaggeris]|uniref:fasciclin domain-containing protein n=1 Tax=Aestuarierythrobacter aquiaggeris TaxID=1898396 RepID=UPI0030174F5B